MRADEIDEKIDAALRSYAEPRAAPESRVVLARVLERAREKRSPGWGRWAWLIPAAGCAAALVLAAAWLLRAPAAPQIAWTPKAPGVVSIATAPDQALPPRAAARAVSASGERVQRPPKLDMFPTPTPLSREEQQLVAFLNQTPPAVAKQIAEAQQHIDDPITISPITIRPLDEDEPTDQPNGKDQP
jgi:hypothetical protein